MESASNISRVMLELIYVSSNYNRVLRAGVLG